MCSGKPGLLFGLLLSSCGFPPPTSAFHYLQNFVWNVNPTFPAMWFGQLFCPAQLPSAGRGLLSGFFLCSLLWWPPSQHSSKADSIHNLSCWYMGSLCLEITLTGVVNSPCCGNRSPGFRPGPQEIRMTRWKCNLWIQTPSFDLQLDSDFLWDQQFKKEWDRA